MPYVVDLTSTSTIASSAGSTVDYARTMPYANPLENPAEDYVGAIYMGNTSGRPVPKGPKSRLNATEESDAVDDATRQLSFDFDNVRDALPFALWNDRAVVVVRD